MHTSVRSLMAATLLSGSVFVAAPAAAQDIEISGNASIVSQYRFRGVDLSGGDPAIQGGIDVGLPAGFYVGTWGSSIDNTTLGGFGHTELDIYGGWSSEIAPGVTFDVGGLYYLFPNAVPGDFDYFELYTSLGFEFGPAGLEVGVAYSPKQDALDLGGKRDNFYIYTDVGIGIPDSPISINAHLGYTVGSLTYTTNEKAWDYSIGVDVALTENLSVGAAYMDAEGNSAPYNFVDDAFVVTLGVSF